MQNLRVTGSVELINVQDPMHKNQFDNYNRVKILKFSQKLAENQYICVATLNISSLSEISSSLLFLQGLRTTG